MAADVDRIDGFGREQADPGTGTGDVAGERIGAQR